MDQTISLLVVFIVIYLGFSLVADELPLAETPLGTVRGTWATSRSGRKYAAFKGIPYAKPPIGKLRLQPPVASEPWEGIKDAVEEVPTCIQPGMKEFGGPEGVMGVEDCLYLSVFTHNVTGRSPVLFHIHGGAFVWGRGNADPIYLMDENLVIVNINYRLGIFGFLTFETEELRGNQGLKDQVLALKWVKENIAAFGGDPDSVTIIGESAGGASVHFQTLSPLSRGLFHGAISESGTAYSPWALAVPGGARARAEKLMRLIGCPTNPKEAIPCLMEKDAADVVEKHNDFLEFQVDPMNNFIPSLEPPGPESFLSGPIEDWESSSVPLLMGIASAEGLMRTIMLMQNGTDDLKWPADSFNGFAPATFLYEETASHPDEVTRKLQEYYSLGNVLSVADWVNLTLLYSDAWFNVPVIEGANKHNGDVYFYYYDYILSNWLNWGLNYLENEELVIGANHCAEFPMIWDLKEMFGNKSYLNEEEIKLSKTIIRKISNFAHVGVPERSEKWKKWTSSDHYYMDIGRAGEFHLKKGLAEDRYNFWKSLDYRGQYDRTVEENIEDTCTDGKVVASKKSRGPNDEL